MATGGDDGGKTAQRILRMSDIAKEPLEILMPIGGYEDMLLVSLEIAVEPLTSFLPAVQSYAYAVKERCENPSDGLTPDQSAAIMLYSMGWKPLDKCNGLHTIQLQEIKPPFPLLHPISLDSNSNKPTVATSINNDRQAFISYCHRDKNERCAFVQALEKANIFTTIWTDEKYMTGDTVDSIVTAIRQSKAVFVLLSDAYCSSDICRREWEFAMAKHIKFYPIIVEKGFRTASYDWVSFNIGNRLFYRSYEPDHLESLINTLRMDIIKKN
ncbi:unnamed protein product [Rotaria magnacalcarata]|uniref:TIR domain-containing protein n=1 Tax=Rotaria magnacalcarata TaxID=392030 RepID=A0A819CAS9_9BILA|nr:unnamed protein product [Rotaria magnacalcarata]CAF3811583.1 unnamed protein product [Rotaria magnacalcarata]CAF4070365.1 unnamed protein product [Rotaria magnacalcarata]CAF4483947.1 unnamed protein product [Rotaria magnacalcarata]